MRRAIRPIRAGAVYDAYLRVNSIKAILIQPSLAALRFSNCWKNLQNSLLGLLIKANYFQRTTRETVVSYQTYVQNKNVEESTKRDLKLLKKLLRK